MSEPAPQQRKEARQRRSQAPRSRTARREPAPLGVVWTADIDNTVTRDEVALLRHHLGDIIDSILAEDE